MTLEQERKKLNALLDQIPAAGMHALGGSGASLFILDFIICGAIKRTLSLGHGLLSMIEARNITCSRALVRMQIDTVSRLLAYTYVSDPEEVAKAVIEGTGFTPVFTDTYKKADQGHEECSCQSAG
ncbi:hypothetical protein VDR21_21170, partial [Xanthomonas campestris pv. campestris]|nr:hypothetical protein [Xanthomonas campestris pv. campestris]